MSQSVPRTSFSAATVSASVKLFSVMSKLIVRMVLMRMPVVLIRIPTVLQNVIPAPVSCLTVSVPQTEPESLEILIQTKYLK